MKILIVYNPNSGQGKGAATAEKIKQTNFFAGQDLEIFELKDNSGDIFNKYKNESFDTVVAIGGDGTINTCVRLILGSMPQAKLLIVPSGSSNALAMSIGAPLSLRKKIKKLNKPACLQNKIIDIGEVNGKIFLVSVIAGYAAEVTGNTEQKIKNRYGFFGYALDLIKHRHPSIYKFKLSVDGKNRNIEVGALSVLNAFSGVGGIPTRQKTSYDDGLLDVIFMRYDNFFGFLISILFMFLAKAHPKKKYKHFSGREIILARKDNKQKISLQVDGEMVDFKEDKIVFKVLPKKLSVIV